MTLYLLIVMSLTGFSWEAVPDLHEACTAQQQAKGKTLMLKLEHKGETMDCSGSAAYDDSGFGPEMVIAPAIGVTCSTAVPSKISVHRVWCESFKPAATWREKTRP